MTIASNIVVEWLHSLHLSEYAESFIDNGYDDLEICKQISEPDLDAIGVFKQSHRLRLLQSVKRLREQGAASVYFSLEESSACLCEDFPLITTKEIMPEGEHSPSQQTHQSVKFLDEYEECKTELVRIPRIQLRLLLQEKLDADGIHLACQPYTTIEGERGYLEGLASRYADLFKTHYSDVLERLEELRCTETSPRLPITPFSTSHLQPVYVPGKYSPSSCLSDKEEDEIYGFGYGIFGRQMLQQRQQKLALASQNFACSKNAIQNQSIYQSCLSPRSAFFYEFPPTDQGHNNSKKKTTFSRLLRGLKTHRKEKHGQSPHLPRHTSSTIDVAQRVDTPDSLLQSGLDLTADTVLRSIVDPRDYDRLKYLRTNGSQFNSFEEIIHKLKIQEALTKKERFNKEHEEIMKDIRHGLMQFGKEGQSRNHADDTYMYDEEARCGDIRNLDVIGGHQHWYDEPPYESDPEDFLMGCNTGDGNINTTMGTNRIRDALNAGSANCNKGVISLRTDEDISLPKYQSRKTYSIMRGLILPQGHNNPPTIIPLTHCRTSRGSAEYASSDVQSRSSGEEDNVESPRSQSTDYEEHEPGIINSEKWVIKTHPNTASIKHSDNHKSRKHSDDDATNVTVTGIAGRARHLRQDVQRKISRLRQQHGSMNETTAFTCSASSIESLPSGSGSSSTQALVRVGSNHSSISYEEREFSSPQQFEHHSTVLSCTPSSSIGPLTVLCRAKALIDCMPNPYDKDALAFKKGDTIDVLQMNTSGLWKGSVHNRLGFFKFINVKVINDKPHQRSKWGQKYKQRTGSVPELLQRMNLEEYISVFLLNGYEDLELFRELEPADLDFLRIQQPEHRAKILTAVQLLHDLRCSEGEDLNDSCSEVDEVSGLGYSISQLDIKKNHSQTTENDLNVMSTDSQATEFQANVPLRPLTPASATHISAPIEP